eukprot:COSAG01_NODE_2034_length_8582_cov_36.288459_5_plen_73_part_00
MVQFQRMEILHYLNITISHTAMHLRSHSLCGNKNDTRDPYCHMQIKKGGVWMGLKRSEMGVTGNSINTASGL